MWRFAVVVSGCSPAVSEVLALEGDPVAGELVFERACAGCHLDGEYAAVAGECRNHWYGFVTDLSALSADQIAAQVVHGGRCMPGFGPTADPQDALTQHEMADVTAYVDTTW
ncbi:MAG: c-type cytochrome [Myxococcota bacterium]